MSTIFDFALDSIGDIAEDIETKVRKYLSMKVVDPEKIVIFTSNAHKWKRDPNCIINSDFPLTLLPIDYTRDKYDRYIELLRMLIVASLDCDRQRPKKRLKVYVYNSEDEINPEIHLLFSCGSKETVRKQAKYFGKAWTPRYSEDPGPIITFEKVQAPNPDGGGVQEGDEKQADGCTCLAMSMITECMKRIGRRSSSSNPDGSIVAYRRF